MKARCSSSVVALLLLVIPRPAIAQQSMCAPVSSNPLVMENLCNDAPAARTMPTVQKVNRAKPGQNLLTLSVEEINRMKLSDPPMIRLGDALVFEANRGGFLLEIFLSNGKEIVTVEDGPSMVLGWKKGRVKLDYLESLNQYIVGMKVTSRQEGGTTLLLRGVKIDRKGSYILELEKTHPTPRPSIPDPPMSYPPDPHVMTASVTAPSLFGREPQAGFLAPRLPQFSIHPMMFQSTTGTSDPNHYKYIGREFDEESGLYYMGARHYSPGLGRFIQPDPLVMELHRLQDPQLLNLYQYGHNNPLRWTDETGLDVNLDCSKVSGAQCNQTVTDLNNRKDAQFQVTRNADTGLLQVVDQAKVDAGKLSKSEGALFKAITDQNNHATLQLTPFSASIMGDQYVNPGFNVLDRADLTQFGKANSQIPGEIIAHAAVEAYAGVGEGQGDYVNAHAFANRFFGNVGYTDPVGLPPGAARSTSGMATYTFPRLSTSVNVQKIFITPQPRESVPKNWERIPGNLVVSTADKKK